MPPSSCRAASDVATASFISSAACIAGALTQADLVGLLEESGFRSIRVVRRFPYRIVQGHPFFSLTYEARKSASSAEVTVMYRGPFPSVVTPGGHLLLPGQTTRVPEGEISGCDPESLFVFDEGGNVTNTPVEITCSCALPPGNASPEETPTAAADK